MTIPDWTSDMMNGPGGMMGAGWVGMLLGFLLTLALLAAIIAGTIYLVRALSRPQSGPQRPTQQRPLEILNERYARGELSHEEYQERRRTLGL